MTGHPTTSDSARFWKNLAVFLGLAAGIFVALEGASRTLYADDQRLAAQRAHFEQRAPGRMQTIVLGMSYLWRGVNPEFLREPAFNLAFNHQDTYYSRRLLETYLDRLASVRTVVLGMDINTVAYSAENTHLVPKYYASVYGFWPSTGLDLQFLFTKSMFWLKRDTFATDLLAGRRAHVQSVETVERLGQQRGRGPLLIDGYEYSDEREPPQSGLRRSEQRFFESRVHRHTVANVLAIADLAASKHATVILLTPPWDVARTPVQTETDGFHAWVARTFVAARPNIVFLDLTNTGEYPPGFYSDGYHLNYTGAEHLTRRLQRALDGEVPVAAGGVPIRP